MTIVHYDELDCDSNNKGICILEELNVIKDSDFGCIDYSRMFKHKELIYGE